MKLIVPEPEIELYKDGFQGKDLLGRSETGKRLSELVENIEDPLVIALDGAWGSGKSFFLKCWVGEHLKTEHNHKAQTVYFDAFQHDFMDDPLVALTGVIAKRFETAGSTHAQKIWQRAKSAAPTIGRAALRTTLAIATSGATEIAGSFVDAGLKAGSKELEKATDAFWAKEDGRRAAMEAFKQALIDLTAPDTHLTAPDTQGEPPNKLVIVIDELDRCRPDYALSLLEVIKHFFAVDNVHFVLGVNLEELQNSVRARYGSTVNAARYLQKFIIATMTLPVHNPETRSRSVVADHFVTTINALKRPITGEIKVVEKILKQNTPPSVGLRDAERIATTCVISKPVEERWVSVGYKVLLGVLLVLKTAEPRLFSKILSGEVEFSDLKSFLKLPEAIDDKTDRFTRNLWEVLSWCFANDISTLDDQHMLIPTTDELGDVSPADFLRRIAEHHLMEIVLQPT